MSLATATPSVLPAAALRSRKRWLFACAIVAIAAVAVIENVSWASIAAALRMARSEPSTLGIAAIAYTLAFVLRAVAWRLLLQSPPGATNLFANLQTSLFLNHLLPFKAGEIVRPALLVRHGVPAEEAVGTAVTARVLDFVCLAALTAVLFPAIRGGGTAGNAAIAATVCVACGAAALAALRRWPLPVGPRLIRRGATLLHGSLKAIPLARVGAATPLVLASWVLESAVLLAAANLLGQELSMRGAVGITAFTILFQVIHVTPGGIGVYETAMTAALVSQGFEASEAVGLAVLTHSLKFAYAFGVGGLFAVNEGVLLLKGQPGGGAKTASRFELGMARLWNVVNEGKPFTPLFTLAVVVALSLPRLTSIPSLAGVGIATAAVVPLAVVFYRFDFPLRLRAALWVYLGAFAVATRSLPLETVGVVLGLYFGFTVVLWGTIYYHLRIGTAWTNGFRFVRLVVENPDPTSGNFLEQVPKVLLLVLLFQFGMSHSTGEVAVVSIATWVVVAVSALLLHQWFFTWVPPLPQPIIRVAPPPVAPARRARRVIAIVIDGCRADRLAEARTPFLDSMRAAGLDVTAMSTVYPARTVTGFSSMLTGAAPAVHGMRSNFVPSLGVKCDSVFDALRRHGQKGRLVGIAHLVDAFGADVEPVTAVMDNDAIDSALVEAAKRVLRSENPELLVLQLLSVDQTGHARGSYNPEYLAKIEETDRTIESFLGWCEREGYLKNSTVIVTSDHGQGIGIGGHGHMSPPEIRIPCIISGAGVEAPGCVEEPRSIVDIAATICASLGIQAPTQCVGRDLLTLQSAAKHEAPVVFVVPALNEAERLPLVLAAIDASGIDNHEVIVVDDGSSDATGDVARASGAFVVTHPRTRGLGGAVRTGLAAARSFAPRAVIYIDADGEYDAREAPRILAPIEAGIADYVSGSRFRGTPMGMTGSRRLANRVFSLLLSVCGRHWISDGQSGFRAFAPRALAVAEIVHDYNYAQVLTLDLLRKGMRMVEVPTGYQRRSGGRSFVGGHYLWRVPLGMVKEMSAP